MTKKFALFAGPSLPPHYVLPNYIHLYPPVKSGDLYKLLNSNYTLVSILDGLFHGVPSIWHREILSTMDEGIPVWGASSMGALRSSELKEYGMKGFGHVYDWYSNQLIDGDDEVALLHSPDPPYSPLTIPIVDIRYCLITLYSLDIGEPLHESLISAARSIPYWERNLSSLKSCLLENGFDPVLISSLVEYLADADSVKIIDAGLLLDELTMLDSRSDRISVSFCCQSLKQISSVDLYKDLSIHIRSQSNTRTRASISSALSNVDLYSELNDSACLHSFLSYWIEDQDPYRLHEILYMDIRSSTALQSIVDHSLREGATILTRNEITHFYYLSAYFFRILTAHLVDLDAEYYRLARFCLDSRLEYFPSKPSFFRYNIDGASALSIETCIALEIFLTSEAFGLYCLDRLHLLQLYASYVNPISMNSFPVMIQDYLLVRTFGIGPLGVSRMMQDVHNLKYSEYCSFVFDSVS